MSIKDYAEQIKNKSFHRKDPLHDYIEQHSLRLHPAQEKLIKKTLEDEKSYMIGSADALQFLAMLCRIMGAKKTLDIGVYTGYSAMTIAMALPEDGKVVGLDITDEWLHIGRPYWKEVGVDPKIDVHIAPALETLQKLIDDGESETFDFAFIDAAKTEYCEYFDLCKKLIRKGGVMVFDNTLWGGCVADPSNHHYLTEAIRALNDKVAADHSVDVSILNLGDGTTIIHKR